MNGSRDFSRLERYPCSTRNIPRFEGGDIVVIDRSLPTSDSKEIRRWKIGRIERHVSDSLVYMKILGEVGFPKEYMDNSYKYSQIQSHPPDKIFSFVSRPSWKIFADSVPFVNQALIMGQSCLDCIRKCHEDDERIRLFARSAAHYALSLIGGCEFSHGTEWER